MVSKTANPCWRCEKRPLRRFRGRGFLCGQCTRSEADRSRAELVQKKLELEWQQSKIELEEIFARLAEQEKADSCSSGSSVQEVPTRSKVAIVLDTPNLARRVQAAFGPTAAPDYSEIRKIAEERGEITEAIAGVNDGIPEFWLRHLRFHGYSVGFSHARDCDDHVVSQIVRVALSANIVLIGSGDGRFTAITTILRAIGKTVIVVAVRTATHRNLLEKADSFVDVPVRFKC